jgi:hypothetical protein
VYSRLAVQRDWLAVVEPAFQQVLAGELAGRHAAANQSRGAFAAFDGDRVTLEYYDREGPGTFVK